MNEPHRKIGDDAMTGETGTPMTPDDQYGLKAMAWHGWGSPVGIGLFVLLIAASAALLKAAFWGW
jgi:hypothetical protein